jgi:hypothetical protein
MGFVQRSPLLPQFQISNSTRYGQVVVSTGLTDAIILESSSVGRLVIQFVKS